MAFDKAALGNRHVCYECEVKFYDLNKDPICPSCKADQSENPNPNARDAFLASLSTRGRKKKKEEPVKEVVEAVPEASDEDEDELEDLENELGEGNLLSMGEEEPEED